MMTSVLRARAVGQAIAHPGHRSGAAGLDQIRCHPPGQNAGLGSLRGERVDGQRGRHADSLGGVNELDVVRELAQDSDGPLVMAALQDDRAGIAEIAGVFPLYVTNGPLLQDIREHGTIANRDPGRRAQQVVNGAHISAVEARSGRLADPGHRDRVALERPLPDQPLGLRDIATGADPHQTELAAGERDDPIEIPLPHCSVMLTTTRRVRRDIQVRPLGTRWVWTGVWTGLRSGCVRRP